MVCLNATPHTITCHIVEDGKAWNYTGSRRIASQEYQAEWYETYSLEGDTLIDSHQCLKLYLTSSKPNGFLDHSYFGAMYEEGECVYYIALGSTEPTLLYNFSCEPGTTVKVNNFELLINEKKLVKYRDNYLVVVDWSPIEEEGTLYHGIWIEGIGSPLDLMNNTPIWYDGCPYKELVTCKLYDQIIYDKDDFYTSAQMVKEDEVTFTKDQMATIILPTEPDASKGKYYRLDRCEKVEGQTKGQIVFEQELQPRARVPYIIVPSEDFSIDLSTLDLEGLQADTVSIGGISFIGSYVRKALPQRGSGEGADSFYIDIIDTTPDCTPLPGEGQGERLFIGALRAYLLVNWSDPYNPGGTRGPNDKLGIVLKDDPNGMIEIENSKFNNQSEGEVVNGQWSNGKCYDLSGRKIVNRKSSNSKSPRGIYIIDGKKKVK